MDLSINLLKIADIYLYIDFKIFYQNKFNDFSKYSLKKKLSMAIPI